MRVVITGGSGLIGTALAQELTAAGWEVVVLTRSPERVRLPAGVQAAAWDGKSAEGWSTLLDQAQAVVHLAGENIAAGRWSAARKRRIRASRLDSSAALVEGIRRAARKPAVLLQASAVGYYGPRGDERIDESSPPGDDFLAELSVAWEAATQAVEEWGVRRAVLRTGVVLARQGGALAKMLPAFRLGLGGSLGSGRQWFPWIHLADEVAAIRFLLERQETRGPFNLAAPNPVSQRELSRLLARTLGRPCWLPVPAPLLRLALGELAEALLTGQRAEPARLLAAGFHFRHPDLSPALAELLS